MLNPPMGLTVFRGFPLVTTELASRRSLPLVPLQRIASRRDGLWTRSMSVSLCHHRASSASNAADIDQTLLTPSRFRVKTFRSPDRPAPCLASNPRWSLLCLRTLDPSRALSALLVQQGACLAPCPDRSRAPDMLRLLPVALSCLDPDQVGALHSCVDSVRVRHGFE